MLDMAESRGSVFTEPIGLRMHVHARDALAQLRLDLRKSRRLLFAASDEEPKLITQEAIVSGIILALSKLSTEQVETLLVPYDS